jgi:hypothetical protein
VTSTRPVIPADPYGSQLSGACLTTGSLRDAKAPRATVNLAPNNEAEYRRNHLNNSLKVQSGMFGVIAVMTVIV